MRRAPLVGSILAPGTAVIIAQQPPAPAPRDPQRELTVSAADGFTVASVGKIIHDADAAFGNFEGTAIDLSRTPAVPPAEFGGVWIIGAPSVATDPKASHR